MRQLSEPALDAIKTLVENTGIRRVVYMHADHFEPWRHGIQPRYCDDLVAFAEQATKCEFGRKLSLFYKPEIQYCLDDSSGASGRMDNEPIVFLHRTDSQKAMAKQAMAEVLRHGAHEIHVHLHHEGFTISEVQHVPAVAAWLKANSDPERDARRFEFFLRLALDAIREDTGLPLDRWGFVHGLWALNASDHRVCDIRNEMIILQRHRCFGDFTFPAGRKSVNPALDRPFTCVPVVADRAYDLPESKPLPVDGQGSARNRFFVWSSRIKHSHCSIDYYSPALQANQTDSEDMVLRWLRDSVHCRGTVYIKTHAHSMAPHYWDRLPAPIIPHMHPAIQTICNQLAEACVKLAIPLEFGTASSIFDELAGRPATLSD